MAQLTSTAEAPSASVFDALVRSGRAIFALSIIALGIENVVCARVASDTLGTAYRVVPVLPFLPSIPWLAYVFGVLIAALGAGLLFRPTLRTASLVLGGLLFACAVVLDAPKAAADIHSVGLRTIFFEPLTMACLALLLPGPGKTPKWLARTARYLLAVSLIIFGIDHFVILKAIASLIPAWIPWHVFWAAFFGAAFIAGGLSIGFDVSLRWGAAGIGLMFAIWVITLHIPRVMGLHGMGGGPRDPDEWSSLLIAISLWGGPWAIAGKRIR